MYLIYISLISIKATFLNLKLYTVFKFIHSLKTRIIGVSNSKTTGCIHLRDKSIEYFFYYFRTWSSALHSQSTLPSKFVRFYDVANSPCELLAQIQFGRTSLRDDKKQILLCMGLHKSRGIDNSLPPMNCDFARD